MSESMILRLTPKGQDPDVEIGDILHDVAYGTGYTEIHSLPPGWEWIGVVTNDDGQFNDRMCDRMLSVLHAPDGDVWGYRWFRFLGKYWDDDFPSKDVGIGEDEDFNQWIEYIDIELIPVEARYVLTWVPA